MNGMWWRGAMSGALFAILAVGATHTLNAVQSVAAAPPHTQAAQGPTVAVVVARAAQRMMTADVRVYGTLQANPSNLITVATPFAAVVTALDVRTGEPVSASQPLATLTPDVPEELIYRQALNQRDYARSNLARQRQMLREHLATRAQVEQAAAALKDAAAKLASLQSEGANRPMTVLRAPAAGVVTSASVEAGQHVNQGAPLLSIAPSDALIAELGVEPEDAQRVRPGMTVRLRAALDPASEFTATVVSVGSAVNARTRLVTVMAQVSPSPGTGTPGSRADPPLIGRFLSGQIALHQDRVLVVPRDAVLIDHQGAFIFVVDHGHARRVAVKTGLESGTAVAVSGDLQAGDRVVVQGNYELADGMSVREVQP
jgi:membrane fusion protein (multidrug efflux system)